MSKEYNIVHIGRANPWIRVEDVNAANWQSIKPQLNNLMADTGKPVTAYFKYKDENELKQIVDEVTDFYRESEAMQAIVSIGEEVVTSFIPFGDEVDKLTDNLHQSIINTKVMSKKKTQSKTWWGIITALIGTLLAGFGIAADPSFLADGFQLAQDLELAIGFVLAVVGWAIKSWGQRTAKEPVK